MRIVIVGAGNVGTALAVLLKQAGHTIIGIASRTEESATKAGTLLGAPYATDPLQFTRQADIVFLTTPDRAIADVCAQIAAKDGFSQGTIVAHTSGAHSSQILNSAIGARTISFHPLQTFANPDSGIINLPGSFITIEGQTTALSTARQLISDLSCRPLEIPTEGKPLYHAAACIACNYFTTLLDTALQVMEAAGVNKEDGLPALAPLIEGTWNTILRAGTTQALTGPIARGDTTTVETHLQEMNEKIPSVIPLYRLLGQATVDVATAKGTLGETELRQLLKTLGGAK
ncbi:MAG: DUF2520 domain-containing protein [Clostridiales bacterium]|jgi:predicted short-subunit dehydrogenase-like oxidoreductase (DUF2520 family)|nr:DUF2520 domain-containing protein [Clostridiales bacterium]